MRRTFLAVLGCIACARPQQPPAGPASVVAGPAPMVEPAPPSRRRLRIIATNDFHGALEPRPDATGARRGGASAVAAAIKAAERECKLPDCATILLDAGDQFQGTPASNVVHGRPVVEMFNYLGLTAAALGNHEFDWTQDTLRAIMADESYPMMGANVRYADGRDVPWIPNDVIVHRGPITVGLIGIVTVETPTATLPGNVADLRFLDPVPIIDSIAPALRARGAEVVIVIAHAGGTCTATECHGEIIGVANRLTAKVDAIIAGHSHTRIDAVVHDMPVLEARSRGQALDVIDLDVGPTVKTIRHEVREIYTDSVKADPDVETIVKRALDRVAPLVNRPVATIADAMRTGGHQYALGNLIADAMRVVGRGDIGIMNNGGIRQSLLAGPATYGSLFEIQPFANNLVRVQVHGSDIRPFFEKALANGTPDFHISGARIVFHAKPTPGIDSITIGGWPIDERRTYTIVESDFMAAGGDNLGWGATAVATESAQVTDLDALIAYLRSLPQPVTAPSAQRIIGP